MSFTFLQRAVRKSAASIATIVIAVFAIVGSAWAAVEVNSADPSQLETVKGIGPALSARIVAERKQGNFKDWSDFETRVVGVGEKNAVNFSRAGLTVAGRTKDGVQAAADTPAAKTLPRKTAGDAPGQTIASSAKK